VVFIAGNAQGEEHHINDQGEHHNRPAVVRNVFVQPFQAMKQRVGDEFQIAELQPANAAGGCMAFKIVVILGANERRAGSCSAQEVAVAISGTGLRTDLSHPPLMFVEHLPITRLLKASGPSAKGEETRR